MITPQGLIDGLDKTTVDGFTEALLIAINSLKDKDGKHTIVMLDPDLSKHITYAREIAEMMLKAREA